MEAKQPLCYPRTEEWLARRPIRRAFCKRMVGTPQDSFTLRPPGLLKCPHTIIDQ
jgi:hypothetical protein